MEEKMRYKKPQLQESKKIGKKETNAKWVMPFFVFLFLQTISFFSYLSIPKGFFDSLIKIEVLFVLFYVWRNWESIKDICSESLSGKYIILFCACCVVSIIPCYLYRGQSPVESLKVISPFLLLLFYFIFYLNNISEEQVIKWFVLVALIKFFILFSQQFTYPDYWFNSYKEGEISNYGVPYKVEVRSDIYRYLLGMLYIFYFAGLYYAYRYLSSNKKIIYLILFLLIVGGIYMEQFRYNMACFLLCWIWLIFNSRKIKISVFHILVLLVVLYTLYSNFDLLFGELKDRTDNDLDDDYVRFLAYSFYLREYWKGPMTILFGNGYPGNSSYGNELKYYQEDFSMFRVDIGIIGTMNTYGVVLVLVFLFYVYKIFKNWRYISPAYQSFLLWLFLMLPLYFTIHYSPDVTLFMAGFFYLIDKSVERNKKEEFFNENYCICKEIPK